MNRILSLFDRMRAFVIRDFQLAVSYRLAFLLRLLTILIVVTIAYYISRIFVGKGNLFSDWRDPLAAWITGLAVLNYFMTNFSSLANAIRTEQMQGTLESVLMTPISVPGLIVASSTLDFIEATLYSSLYLVFGSIFFGVTYDGSYLLAFMILILTTMVFASLGILSASFAMVFKRGDPIAVLLGTSTAVFSGVFFPPQLLPEFMQNISKILPATYGLEAIRGVLIEDNGLSEARGPILTLLMFLAVLLPISLWVFSRAVRRAKREGSLIQY
ncbi:MAG TPA: ABC transporter permease [Pyrinomonadaceae bacterium]|nr:ABC transporter permease [Pyrinomonadaceae bacterium]